MLHLPHLRKLAEELKIPNANRLKKENLIINIRKAEAAAEGIEVKGGVLEITPEGVGFLRNNYSIGTGRCLCLPGTIAPV